MQYSGSSLFEKQRGSKSVLLNLFFIASAAILAFCMVRSASAQQNSQPVLVLTSQKQEYLLGAYLEYLEDPKGELTFEQVRSAQYDSKFSTGKQDILNFGTTDSVYWLRLRIRNDAPTAARWRLELARPTVNTIILYIPEKKTSQYAEKKTGFVYPFATRDIQDEAFIFNLPIESGSEQLIYMSIKDKVLDLPFRIWEADTLGRRKHNVHTLVGLAFGALTIMFIYNLFITIMLWDKGFLYYSCFLIAMIFYLGVGQGYASHYLWPEQTLINTFIVPLSIEFAMMGFLLFAGSFLQITKQSRGWQIVYQISLPLIILFILPTPFIGAKVLDIVFPFILLTFIFVLSLAIHAWLNGYKAARFYLISWTIFLIVTFISTLESMGFFTITKLIPDQMVLFSSVYVAAFQSIALADQFGLYKQETINAQSAFMEQQRKALTLTKELTQTLEHAREELEEKVAERTHELTEVNEKLAREVIERERAQQEAELLARVDPLTGLFNRRHFSHLADMKFRNAIRYKHPLSILIFDIDLFKKVNDTFGHQIGDQALIHVAEIFQRQARGTDVLARYGGEEFIALLPETTSADAQHSAERLRKMLEDSILQIKGHSISLTISIGIAGMEIIDELTDLEELLKQADEALYLAKGAGRNRVVVFEKKGFISEQTPE